MIAAVRGDRLVARRATNERDAFDGEVLDLVVPGHARWARVDRVLSMLTGLSRQKRIYVHGKRRRQV